MIEIENIKFPIYPNDEGYVNVPNGRYICKTYDFYGDPSEEVVVIADGYLPSHYEYIIKKE